MSPGYIVAQESTNAASVIAPGNGPETLLACGVPNLYFHIGAVVKLDGLGPEVHPDGEVVRVLEPVVDELQQQA